MVGGFLGAAALAGVVAQERGDAPEQMLAAGRRAVEIAVRGLSNVGRPDPAERATSRRNTESPAFRQALADPACQGWTAAHAEVLT